MTLLLCAPFALCSLACALAHERLISDAIVRIFFQVAQWVSTLPRLAPYANLFIEHQVEGTLFGRLDDAMLKEMGAHGQPITVQATLH